MLSNNATGVDNQQASREITDEYLAGFTDGEGCFYVGFSKRLDLPQKWQVITEFHLSQNPGGKNVLEALQRRLGCGYLKRNHPNDPKDKSWVFIVKDRNDITNQLIPFFTKHPLVSNKRFDFLVFVSVIRLIAQQKHLTPEGFREIVSLVFSNTKITNKRYTQKQLLSS